MAPGSGGENKRKPKMCGFCNSGMRPIVYRKGKGMHSHIVACGRCGKTVEGTSRDKALDAWDNTWGKAGE